ncbi:hypothetical protein [Streptomyces sp. NPDC058657]|uniref:hypothetical protein n=1 Tax=unclassified Streptomyces TaxID=2593676 RepID=UPI003661FE18
MLITTVSRHLDHDAGSVCDDLAIALTRLTGWTNTAHATDYYKSYPGHAIGLIRPGR